MDKPKQTLLICIDGATWDIIDPMIEEGRLPNFQRFKNQGAWGALKSLEPPLTPVVWTSIASGKKPEKHGVLDFFSTSRDVKVKRIWDILECQGYTIGLQEFPVTWPPRECNGFIIPDNFARDTRTYPEELSFIKALAIGKKNERFFGLNNPFSLLVKVIRHGVSASTLFKGLSYVLRRMLTSFSYLDDFYRTRMLKLYLYSDVFFHLYNRYKPDFVALYFNQPDALGHLFWKYMDAEEYRDISETDRKKYKDVIKRSYIAIDEQIGKILQCSPDDSLIIIVSDHGFGKAITNPYGKALSVRVEALMKLLGFPKDIVGINVHKSTYYRSTLSPRKAMASRKHIVEKLRNVYLAQGGQKIFEVLERGEYVIVDPITTLNVPGDAVVYTDGRECRYEDIIKDTSIEFSGDHKEFGVLLMKGPNVRPNFQIEAATVLDVVPTLLALLGIPVAKDMDGHVLKETIEPQYLNLNPTQYIETYETDHSPEDEDTQGELKGIDEERVLDRLRALGYL